MDDTISRQAAIDALDTGLWGVEWDKALATAMLKDLPSAQPEVIKCKDCKHWVPGYITDNDDFIPPKCGEWQQMVGHSSDDYCSLAERRGVTT